MNPRSFLGLAAATAVVTVAALISVAVRQSGSAPTVLEETLVFPGLSDKVGEVAQIHVRSEDGDLTIEKSGEGWTLLEKGGYPVRDDRVRTAVVGLSELLLAEPKTRIPELYARLQVEDVEAEGARSKVLALKDGAGATLAEVIVGRRKFSPSEIVKGGVYIRLLGDRQSWLATGKFGVPGTAQLWLHTEVIDIPGDRVAQVSLVHPDGTTLTASKASPEDENFIIEDLPEDAFLISDAAPNELASALSAIHFADVAPETEVEFPADGLSKAEIQTFDGLLVSVEMTEKEGETWARFAAGEANPRPASGADVSAEAEEINARVKGWAYQLRDYQATILKRRLDDFLEKGEDEEEDMDLGIGGAFGPPPF